MLCFLVFALLVSTVSAVEPVSGIQCTKNQVINRLTVYEDGALEAECGPIPCGEAGRKCIEDQTSCRAETDVFSGMRWAANGQSVLLRCCTLKSSNKIYVGTDLVTAGSYYVGGQVAKKDLYGTDGSAEYDFIANIRTEQGGVRVWVYRIMCAAGEQVTDFVPQQMPSMANPSAAQPIRTTTLAQPVEEEEEEEEEEVEDEEEEASHEETTQGTRTEEQNDEAPAVVEQQAFNPLRYRPPHLLRSSSGVMRARLL